MKHFAAAAIFALASTAFAGTIKPVSGTLTLTALASGNVTAVLTQASQAYGVDYLRLLDETSGVYSPFLLANTGYGETPLAAGTTFNFGTVAKGDVLAFEIYDASLFVPGSFYLTEGGPANLIESTDASYSTDHVRHAIATGQTLAFEDLPSIIDPGYPTDFFTDNNYNDVTIKVSSNVGITQTPEPSSIALLGTGLLACAGTVRRQFGL